MIQPTRVRQPTVNRTGRRALSARIVNWLGQSWLGHLQTLPFPLFNLSEVSIIRAAERRTGLSLPENASFLAPMRNLLMALENDAQLHLIGRLSMRQLVTLQLANRLRLQEEQKRHPQICQEQIRQPLVIASLPRSGTTLLHRLLAQDPAHRTLAFAEVAQPSLIYGPGKRRRVASDRNAQIAVQRLQWLAPGFAAIHPITASAPEECIGLLQTSFCCHSFEIHARLDSYRKTLHQDSFLESYRNFYQWLQMLQFHDAQKERTQGEERHTQRWVLKSPYHLHGLDALLSVFPDANIIQIHRDPKEALPSFCSLVTTLRAMNSSHVEPHTIGNEMLHQWSKAISHAMMVRSQKNSRQFFDVDYQALVEDPIATVRGIYTHFDYPFAPLAESRMQQWLAENPQHKHGVHHYSLEQFGLQSGEIERHFAAYCGRYYSVS